MVKAILIINNNQTILPHTCHAINICFEGTIDWYTVRDKYVLKISKLNERISRTQGYKNFYYMFSKYFHVIKFLLMFITLY